MTLQVDPVIAEPAGRTPLAAGCSARTGVLVDDHDIIVHGVATMLTPYRDRFIVRRAGQGDDSCAVALRAAFADTVGDGPGDDRADATSWTVVALIDPFGGPRPHPDRLSRFSDAADRVAYFTFDIEGGRRLLALGRAHDVIPKSVSGAELAQALEHLVNDAPGGVTSGATVPSPFDVLSQREREVLGLVSRGCSNQEIAQAMYLSVDTVKTYLRRIYKKLDVENRTQAALLAVTGRP